jgi:acyl-coenzyme A thioesterase PaaI-like protein
MTASGHHPPHAPATKAHTDAEPPTDVPKLPVKCPTITGPMEKLMRVRLLGDRPDGLLGVRTGVMDTGHWVLDMDGRPTGAAAAVILDNTLSAALRTSVDGLNWVVTTELHLNFMRPLPADGTVLEAWTRALVGDEAGGMATGTLQGPDGTEYVQGTGWFQRAEGNTSEGLDRFEALAKQPLGEEEGASLGALLAAGPATPVLPGGRPDFAQSFVPGLGFARKDLLRNSHGALHGGALMMLATLAAQQAMPDRTGYDLQSLRAAYLRPAFGEIATRTHVRYAGSSLRVVDVELFSAEPGSTGKAFVQATAIFRQAR